MSTTERLPLVYVPRTLLGLNFHSWTRPNIQLILGYYNWNDEVATYTKIELMHELHLLVQEYDLNRKDRRDILNAYKSGGPFPRRKPRVHRVPRPTFPVWKATNDRSIAYGRAQTRTRFQHTVEAVIAADLQAHNDAVTIISVPNAANNLPTDCVVCFENLSPQNRPERKITCSCNHEPDVCRSCLSASISTQFNSKVWDQINCPTCGERLDFHDVRAFADSPVFERFEPRSTIRTEKY